MLLAMARLSFSLLILASLTAINADSCGEPDSYPRLTHFSDIVNEPRSLPEGNEIQAGIELVRNFLKTTNLPLIGSVDPLYIETYRIQAVDDGDEMDLPADITATTVKGLLGFEVTDVKISLNSEKFQIDFLFPELSVSGKYNLLPTQQSEFHGNGQFDLASRNLRVQINGGIGKTIEGDMFVEKLESELSLETADAKVTGLFDDEVASEAASWAISNYLPEYVPLMKSAVDEFLEIYKEYGNTKLKLQKFLKREL